MLCIFILFLNKRPLLQTCWSKKKKHDMIYRNALSHNAGLLHSPRPAKLLHVPAEVTFSAFVPEAGFTLPAAGPPAPGSRRATAGWHLNGRCGRPDLGLWPVGHPLLKTRSEASGGELLRAKTCYRGRDWHVVHHAHPPARFLLAI